MKPKAVSLALLSIALLSMTILPTSAQLPADLQHYFDSAERRIVRLRPAAFPELPGNVVRELQRRGCTIPQTAYSKKRHNIVRGEFAKPGQQDWAVLCSAKGISSILVFWNGSARVAEVGPKFEDKFYIGFDVNGTPIYQRTIRTVGRKFIMDHYRAYGGPKPPAIDHQGIDDAFLEKASVIHYFCRGRWMNLTGAD